MAAPSEPSPLQQERGASADPAAGRGAANVEDLPSLPPSKVEGLRRWLWGYDVFVSYTRSDGEGIAEALDHALTAQGLAVFRDAGGLESGDALRPALARAVGRSGTVVLVATPAAVEHKWVNAEIKLALRLNRNVVPLVCGSLPAAEPSPVADALRDRLRIERAGPPYVDDEAVARIVGSIGALRQARRRAAAMALLAAAMLGLALGAGAAAWAAYVQWGRALAEGRVTEAQALAARSTAARLTPSPLSAIALASRAVRIGVQHAEPVPAEAEESLRAALAQVGGAGWRLSAQPVADLWALPDGSVVARDRDGVLQRYTDASTPGPGQSLPLVSFDNDLPVFRTQGGLWQQAPTGELRGWQLPDIAPITRPAVGEVLTVDPNGRFAVTHANGTIVVRDLTLPDAEAVAEAPCGEEPHVAWSPSGGWLAAVCDGLGWRFDAASRSGFQSVTPPPADTEWLRVAISDAGNRWAGLTPFGQVQVWTGAPGEAPLTVQVFSRETLSSADWDSLLVFSPDGRRLLLANATIEVALVDVSSGGRLHVLLRADLNATDLLPSGAPPYAFAEAADALFVGDHEGRIHVWRLAASEPERVAVLDGHDGGMTSLLFEDDGAILTGGLDGTLRRWPPPPSGELSRAQWRAAPVEVRGLPTRIPDGFSTFAAALGETGWIVSAGSEHPPRLSLLKDGQVPMVVPLAPPLRWARNGRWVVSGDAPAVLVRVADGARLPLPEGELVALDEEGDAGAIRTPEGHWAVVDWSRGPPGAREVDPPTRSWQLAGLGDGGNKLLWQHDGAWTVTDGRTGQAIRDGTAADARLCLRGQAVCDGRTIVPLAGGPPAQLDATGADILRDGEACYAEASAGGVRVHLVAGFSRTFDLPEVVALACDRGGVAFGTLSGEVAWSRGDASLVRARVGEGPIKAVVWMPDGEGLLVAGVQSALLTWPLGTLRMVRLPAGDTSDVAAAVSPDGRWVGLAGDDQVLRVHPARAEDLLLLAETVLGGTAAE